jgi:phosphatidylinositol alpha-1,6-mannosyltransferase
MVAKRRNGGTSFSLKETSMLFLTLATFSQTGGVQMVCRSMTKALNHIQQQANSRFEMISLCDAPNDRNERYIPANTFKGFSYQRMNFCRYALRRASSVRIVLLGHVNLLPLAWLIKRLWPETRIILLAHGKEVWGGMPGWKKRFLNGKAEIWAVSRFTKKMLVTRHQIRPRNIRVLNNCLDPFFRVPENFEKPLYLLNRYGLKAHHHVLLTITRLDSYEKDKGYDLVLDALPDLLLNFPDLRYVIAGKPSIAEASRLLTKIDVLALKAYVVVPGFVQEEELTDHHLLANTFILPSSKEGFGLVFLEAAACGSSIIAGNKDGSIDAVMDGALATLVDPSSKKELTAALHKHLAYKYNPAAAALQQELSTKQFSFRNYKSNIEALLYKTNAYDNR